MPTFLQSAISTSLRPPLELHPGQFWIKPAVFFLNLPMDACVSLAALPAHNKALFSFFLFFLFCLSHVRRPNSFSPLSAGCKAGWHSPQGRCLKQLLAKAARANRGKADLFSSIILYAGHLCPTSQGRCTSHPICAPSYWQNEVIYRGSWLPVESLKL